MVFLTCGATDQPVHLFSSIFSLEYIGLIAASKSQRTGMQDGSPLLMDMTLGINFTVRVQVPSKWVFVIFPTCVDTDQPVLVFSNVSCVDDI